MKQLTADNYQSTVAESEKLVVKFYADWCPDCRRITATYEMLAETHPDIVFASADIEKEPVLKEKLNITSIPDVRFFVRGKQVQKLVEMNSEVLEEAVTALAHHH